MRSRPGGSSGGSIAQLGLCVCTHRPGHGARWGGLCRQLRAVDARGRLGLRGTHSPPGPTHLGGGRPPRVTAGDGAASPPSRASMAQCAGSHPRCPLQPAPLRPQSFKKGKLPGVFPPLPDHAMTVTCCRAFSQVNRSLTLVPVTRDHWSISPGRVVQRRVYCSC